MCAIERYRIALLAAASVLSAGCVANPAPKGFLPKPEEAQHVAVGGWIELQFFATDSTIPMAGELLAVTRDSLWLATESGGVAVSAALISEGRLFGYDSHYSQIVAAAFVGTLATISNGFLLMFTAPMWILGGSATAAGQSKIAITELPGVATDELRLWTRFPAGLPPGFDLSDARPVRRETAGGGGASSPH